MTYARLYGKIQPYFAGFQRNQQTIHNDLGRPDIDENIWQYRGYRPGCLCHTDWMVESALPLKLDGLNTDQVYENFLRKIAGGTLLSGTGETLKMSVEWDARRKELQKQITVLQTKVRREKQLNKQVQLNAELKKLKREFDTI